MKTLRKIVAWIPAIVGFPLAFIGCAIIDFADWIAGK